MVGVAQLVRASDCGPEGRGFDPHLPPHIVIIRMYTKKAAYYAVFLRLRTENFYVQLKNKSIVLQNKKGRKLLKNCTNKAETVHANRR